MEKAIIDLHEVKNTYFEGKEEFEQKINKANTTMTNGFQATKSSFMPNAVNEKPASLSNGFSSQMNSNFYTRPLTN